jgi:hypothetical protein
MNRWREKLLRSGVLNMLKDGVHGDLNPTDGVCL